ncbi:MAG: 3-dehydroquinate synthase [Verrucomicrobiota bacterium]
MTPDSQIQQRLTYSIEYPIIFTESVFDPKNRALAEAMDRLKENRVHRAMVFVDSNVADLFPQITQDVSEYFDAYSSDIELAEAPRIIPGGEILKGGMDVVIPMVSAMIDAHLCRHSFVIIVGGGAVLDTVGFAASLVHRGLRTIRIPTTILAQADGGTGVKTALNFEGSTNAVGTFAPPFAVLNDWQFFYSLSERDWAAGAAEAFRMAVIRDREFFEELCTLAPTLSQHNGAAIQRVVHRSAVLFLNELAVQNDPFEHGVGQPLDFACWAAHKLGALSDHEVSYGETIAMGVLIDCLYATEQGWLPEADFEQLHEAFAQIGLPLWFNELDLVGGDGNLEVLQGIPDYQEHKGGQLSVTFPDGIGKSRQEETINLEIMERVFNRLKTMASSAVNFGG